MRRGILIHVATLAASLATSFGQVTNVNVAIAVGYNLLANPLSSGVTNGANEIKLIIDGEQIGTWTGASFNWVGYDFAFGGWVDDNFAPSSPPSLPPGSGFFLLNRGPATNVTFIGINVVFPGTTNSLNLPSGYSLLGSPFPSNGTNITSAPVNLPLIDGMQILMWTNNAYDYWSYDSGFGGWVGKDFKPRTPPSYSVGQGFFLFNPGLPTTWQQSLPRQESP